MKHSYKVFTRLLLFTLSLTGCGFGISFPSAEDNVSNNSQPTEDFYTITWKDWNGTTLETDSNVKKGTMPTYDGVTPTRPDDEYTYTWTGWEPEVVPATANQTYTATYSKTEYVINFDLNGGVSASYSGSKTVGTFSRDVFFFDCVKEGWNFRGWSYSGTKIFDEKGNQLITPTMAKTMTFVALYAQTAKMTIFSNLEGAGIVTGEGEYQYNTYIDVSAHPKQGYSFVGWYYQDVLLSNAENYKYMIWSEDVYLEARFKLASFLMNIHANNENHGSVLLRSVTNNDYRTQYQEYRDFTTPITIAALSKTDVKFLGWYNNDNQLVETNAIYSFFMPNHDYTLEAKWNYFTVSYNLNGGTNNPSNPNSYTIDSSNIVLNEPTRNGYDFLGWQYKGNYITDINPNWIDNIELNAIWRTHTYSIFYELNGGTNNPSNPNSYTIESEAILLRSASRFGYIFDGWYKTAGFSDRLYEIESGSYGDLNLYAKWRPVSYSITYNLNGGTNSSNNPTTYTIESAFTFAAPSKTGYTFLGWFDSNGNQITSIITGTTGALVLTAHWNEGNTYSITLDPNGGSVSETLINVQYDHSYSLPTPTRLGYYFDGWFDDSTQIKNFGTWKYASNKTFVAHWLIYEYDINYTLNGGTNNPSNPFWYTVEDSITFADPSKTGYDFSGWFIGENAVTGIPAGTTGTINVEARWTASLNALLVTSDDISKGTVAITSGSGYSDETITVVATPIGDCFFEGWYHESIKISSDSTYTFKMPTSDYSLVAHFLTKTEEEWNKTHGVIPVFSSDGKTITYGLYPQKKVNDASLLTALNGLTTPELNDWYLYNDDYYAKNVDTSTWFKCEPITWNVLSDQSGELLVVSNVLLDTHCYYNSTENRTINGSTIYPNNYKYSDIRTWLNDDFYNTAFALENSCIQVSTIDSFIKDKVFLLSYGDYTNGSYGFSTSTETSNTRKCISTDWSIAKDIAGGYAGYYWTRSPRNYHNTLVWIVFSGGGIDDGIIVNNSSMGVRPGLSIKII